MSIPLSEVREGAVFAKDRGSLVVLRQIISVSQDGSAKYNEYELDESATSARWIRRGLCSERQITRWAERLSTRQEQQSLVGVKAGYDDKTLLEMFG